MTKSLELLRGEKTLVDDFYYDQLVAMGPWRLGPKNYIVASRRIRGVYRYLHVTVAELAGLDVSRCVNHKNGNRLDNRAANLRPSTNRQSACSRGPGKNSKTGVKGVCWVEERKKYRAAIRVNRKLIHLGYYERLKEAALAYNEAAKTHFGAFAWLNHPQDVRQAA